MVKIIAFDMWQTLGTYEFDLYGEVLKLTKLNMSLKGFILKMSKIEVEGMIGDKERFVKKIRLLGVTDKLILQKARTLYTKAHDSIFLYDDTVETLQELKNRGKIIALITNVDSYAHKKIMSLFPEGFFDLVLASYKVGIRKPDKRIFLKLTEKYSQKSEDILMVGDSEELDIKPARLLRWKTAFIDRSGQKSKYADYNLRGLKELLELMI